MVAPLAGTVSRELEAGTFLNGHVPASIGCLIQDGSLKLSMRDVTGHKKAPWHLAVGSIASSARCDVICLPPFYPVHTLGVFEAQWVAKNTKSQSQTRESSDARDYMGEAADQIH